MSIFQLSIPDCPGEDNFALHNEQAACQQGLYAPRRRPSALLQLWQEQRENWTYRPRTIHHGEGGE